MSDIPAQHGRENEITFLDMIKEDKYDQEASVCQPFDHIDGEHVIETRPNGRTMCIIL